MNSQSTIAEPTITTFSHSVFYNRGLVRLIRAGNYDKIKGELGPNMFPTKRTGKGKMESVLIHFGEGISKKDAIARMAELGYRPGEAHEIVSFGNQHPKEQLKGPILALGLLHCVGNNEYQAVYLSGDEGLREVGVLDLPDDWLNADPLDATIRFLALRDPQ